MVVLFHVKRDPQSDDPPLVPPSIKCPRNLVPRVLQRTLGTRLVPTTTIPIKADRDLQLDHNFMNF